MSIALALFTLLAGTVFAIVQGSVSASTFVQREETRNREVEGFLDLLRRAFRTLPGDGSVAFNVAELLGKRIPKVTLTGGDFIFPGGSAAGYYSALIVTAREQVGGLWSLGLERELTDEEEKNQSSLEQDPRAFLPLVSDIKTFQWRFFDSRSAQWLIEWPDTNSRPSSVELTVQLAGSDASLRSVFWLPNVQRNARNANSGGNNSGNPGSSSNPGGRPGGAPGSGGNTPGGGRAPGFTPGSGPFPRPGTRP